MGREFVLEGDGKGMGVGSERECSNELKLQKVRRVEKNVIKKTTFIVASG